MQNDLIIVHTGAAASHPQALADWPALAALLAAAQGVRLGEQDGQGIGRTLAGLARRGGWATLPAAGAVRG